MKVGDNGKTLDTLGNVNMLGDIRKKIVCLFDFFGGNGRMLKSYAILGMLGFFGVTRKHNWKHECMSCFTNLNNMQ